MPRRVSRDMLRTMVNALEERLAGAEATLRRLERRVLALERGSAVPVPAAVKPKPPVSSLPTEARPKLQPKATPRPAPKQPEVSFEEILGGRVLAWVGGVAVILASTFFVVTAVHRGWIDIPTRVLLAFIGSSLLVVAGAWLHEKKGQTEAAQALVAESGVRLFTSA